MRFEDAQQIVGTTPHMTARQARTVYDFVLDRRPQQILELGFAHGTSTVYFAAALDEIGGGKVTTIDRAPALEREPNIHDLLGKAGLAHLVDVVISETSYTWDLAQMLQADPRPSFDFAYIDGAHVWDVDALAFTLVDRVLAPGGTVLFDDLNWTLDRSPSLREAPWVKALPEEQRTTPQVRMVYELLVRTHPDYADFRDEQGWGWATKRRQPPGKDIDPRDPVAPVSPPKRPAQSRWETPVMIERDPIDPTRPELGWPAGG